MAGAGTLIDRLPSSFMAVRMNEHPMPSIDAIPQRLDAKPFSALSGRSWGRLLFAAALLVGLAGRATAIGDAIALSTKRLQKQPADQRVLILLTDGVNTAGTLDPQKAAQIAHDNGVRIHAIAFGGDGGALSLFGFQLPMGGDEVDEAGLQRIASLTGGHFFRARDTDALAGIYKEIDKLEPIQRQGQSVRPKIERYPLPLGWALALGLLALFLRRRA